jgi:membrane protein implicated in regulation of membrane protease activity
MDWTASTWWWLGTAALVAAELATGTFYLLMLAVGTAAAALAAHAGLGHVGQYTIGALIGIGAVAAWHRRRGRPVTDTAANPDVNLDIGSRVRVEAWTADGTARVHYRGTAWDARFAGQGPPQPGEHVIRAVLGNQLQLDRPAP